METFLVGGAVRDKLLGLPVTERDWVVVGSTPEAMLAAGFRRVGRDFPVFLHPETHEEYALARTERKQGHGYGGFVCHAAPDVSLEQDLLRRDLTINAIAQAADGSLIDPYGGQADLAARVLRHVSPAFREDPLRVLRTARFAASLRGLGFRIAPETLALMRTIVGTGELAYLAPDRIWLETEKALHTANPEIYLEVLASSGAWQALAPGLPMLPLSLPALVESVRRTTATPLRFAALALDLAALPGGCAPDSALALAKAFNANRSHRDLALSATTLPGLLAAPPQSGLAWLECLEQLDALRRRDRFEDLVALLEVEVAVRHPPQRQALAQQLCTACALAAAVPAAPLLARGLRDGALGTALRAERAAALDTLAAG